MVNAQEYLDEKYPCDCDSYYHKKNCSKKNLEELNLRNLNLEGDLDLEEFSGS